MVKYDKINNTIELRRKSIMLCYCKKCGRVVQRTSKKLEKPCDYCKNTLHVIPKEFTVDGLGTCLDNNLKQQFIDEYIKSSPEFDQYLFDHRDVDLHNRRMENQAKLEHGKVILEEKSRTPKCPSCGSSNISKIGVVGRAVSFKLVGFASSKIGKTHKCNNCGTMW